MRNRAAKFVAGVQTIDRLPAWRQPHVAFAGRSNVGKSSLINRLVGMKSLARVSKTPGRTQQINLFLIEERLIFADLPGYGFAKVPFAVKDHWKQLVEAYMESESRPRCTVVIVDIRRGLQDDDVQLLDYLAATGVTAIIAATKVDKIGRGERRALVAAIHERFPGPHVVLCSSHTGEGIDEIWSRIESACRSR